MLFSEEPQAALPDLQLISAFPIASPEMKHRWSYIDRTSLQIVSVYDLIKNTVKETTAMVEGIQKLGPSGLEPVKYPKKVGDSVLDYTKGVGHTDVVTC